MNPEVTRKIKQISLVVFLNLLFLFTAIYLVVQYLSKNTEVITKEGISIVTRQEIFDGEGFIARDESVIMPSVQNNFIKYEIANGSKVGKDQPLALIYNSVSDMNTTEMLQKVEKQLDILTRSNINKEIAKTTVEKVDQDINDYYTYMITDLQNDKIGVADKYRDDMLVLMNKRQIITNAVKNFDDIISGYQKQKNDLIGSMTNGGGSSSNVVYAPAAGLFYHNADGYEEYFTADLVKNFSLEKFNEILTKTPNENHIKNSLGKIINNYKWHIIIKVDKQKTFDFIQNKYYDIVFPYSSNKTVKFKLVNKTEDYALGYLLLLLEATNVPENFNFLRKQPVKIVYESISGLKIPETALRHLTDDEGNTVEGVFILKGNTVKFRELKEEDRLGKYDNYYIYKDKSTDQYLNVEDESQLPLKIYDLIITGGKDIYDGKILN